MDNLPRDLPGRPARDVHRAQMRVAARDNRRDSQRLADALDGDELRLMQLPRLRLTDGAEVATEATPFWQRRALPVTAALSASPRGEVAQRVGVWMLDAACALAACGSRGPVSIPLSAAMLEPATLPRDVEAALAKAALPGERLELRLPELALIEPSAELTQCLSELYTAGVRLVIDDFGAHYGSITLLRQVKLSAIRLDPSLTHDLTDHGEDACVVAALAAIAHGLGMRVIGCAVDGDARRAALARLGVDEGVGPARLWSRLSGAA